MLLIFSASYNNSSFDLIVLEDAAHFYDFGKLLAYLKLEGKLYICNSSLISVEKLKIELKLSGFVHIILPNSSTGIKLQPVVSQEALLLENHTYGILIASKPSYEIGASIRLALNTSPSFNTNKNEEIAKFSSVWKINARDMDDLKKKDDLIDEDDLLDDKDKQKPDPSTLKGIINRN